ncbi:MULTISPECIES: DeoR/GlpR family DNA-binding transcription regulator [Enterobacter]|jgi:DeoR/GlpR family transcriptional regulator of sugar metabolism|uniref:DeoR/GlpR transcriptional regulator n=4 Tax=Enterobacter hormaechei TaxID=158836 RepID=A0AAE9BKE6_9ENTR|nr:MULTISPECIES: DeoR/GlpR family DNA-binding transcription regulator [Enterobacter]ASA03095.1 DeoR family transcriptional regulator [Enterobacter cloacae complex sp.]EIM36430.1 putative aga operon transcriptional repressor [Enterobacter cloacae subsp. cloacae GS1]EMA0458580.1 DeoR/GlpR transcriptional regulator [Enterobacter hormaechei subsp. hoffmannii]MBU5664331.1 DeoR/GlpR family DNA-binding transcription regulator [Enterobacteriaceae bacterium S32_ASV_15]RYA72376.1 DeoR/GlpR transcription
MLTSQRKQLILEKLEAEGQVQSTALSLFFSVSEDTIRRDLRELAAEGRLQRVHGGALPASSAIAPFAERQSVKMDAKKRVARRGAQLISPGQVVIIDGGTTTSELITFLPPDLPITVVTHSPGIALGLVGHPSIEVILIGGRLYKHSIVTVGAAAIEGINNIHADLFFMGVTGVHPEAGLTTGDYEEACIKRAFSGRAAETVVLASPEKINTASAFVIGDLSLVNTLVVENTTDERWVSAMKEKGVTVIASQ